MEGDEVPPEDGEGWEVDLDSDLEEAEGGDVGAVAAGEEGLGGGVGGGDGVGGAGHGAGKNVSGGGGWRLERV